MPAFAAMRYVTADARDLLEEMGHHSMDVMTKEQTLEFQRRYLERKLALEAGAHPILTERSTVDVAAYWLVRDAAGLPVGSRDEYVETCRAHAEKYDLHVYLPFGVIPFRSDGYRSENLDFHEQIGRQIKTLLDEWKLEYITLEMADMNDRVARILEHVRRTP